MKSKLFTSLLVLGLLAAITFILNSRSSDEEKAGIWASRACDSSLNFTERAFNAARANFLDSRWLRLSEAANALVAYEGMSKNAAVWKYAPGNDGGALIFQMQQSIAQYDSECALAPKDDSK